MENEFEVIDPKIIIGSLDPALSSQVAYSVLDLGFLVAPGVGMTEECFILLDNDVLNALEKPLERPVQYAALAVLFGYLQTFNDKFRVAVTPVLLWEFRGDLAFSDDETYTKMVHELARVARSSGLQLVNRDMDTFEKARGAFERFKADRWRLRLAHWRIGLRHWKVDLKGRFGTILPMAAARRFSPRIRARYFSDFHANSQLQSVVETRIVRNKENDAEARRFADRRVETKSKLLKKKSKKKALAGFGDLDLLSSADIASQYHHGVEKMCIGLTFDEVLAKSLLDHANIRTGFTITDADSEANRLEKIRTGFAGKAEIDKIVCHQRDFLNGLRDYLFTLPWVYANGSP